jgi:type II secretory pathway predicted ATPase ExeA
MASVLISPSGLVHLEGLPKEESFAYIEGSIRYCGNTTPLFTNNAMKLIHQASGGIMRGINMIASSTMTGAYLSKSPQVEAEHVKKAIER